MHVFLTSALVGGEWSASRPGRFTPRKSAPLTHWTGGRVGPRSGLDDVEKRKFLPLPGLELRSLSRPNRSQSLYRLSYPGFHVHMYYIHSHNWSVGSKNELVEGCSQIAPCSLRCSSRYWWTQRPRTGIPFVRWSQSGARDGHWIGGCVTLKWRRRQSVTHKYGLLKGLTSIREVPGSNIGRDPRYPDWGFPQLLHSNAKMVPQLGHESFLPNPFQFISHPVIRSYMASILER
jgi:hypothetical protein